MTSRSTPRPEGTLRIVKRSNQDGVRSLNIDGAGEGCFEVVLRGGGPGGKTASVPPRTVALAERLVKRDAAYPKLVQDQREGPAHKAVTLLLAWIAEGEQGMPNADTLADAVAFARVAVRNREALLRHIGEKI